MSEPRTKRRRLLDRWALSAFAIVLIGRLLYYDLGNVDREPHNPWVWVLLAADLVILVLVLVDPVREVRRRRARG